MKPGQELQKTAALNGDADQFLGLVRAVDVGEDDDLQPLAQVLASEHVHGPLDRFDLAAQAETGGVDVLQQPIRDRQVRLDDFHQAIKFGIRFTQLF